LVDLKIKNEKPNDDGIMTDLLKQIIV